MLWYGQLEQGGSLELFANEARGNDAAGLRLPPKLCFYKNFDPRIESAAVRARIRIAVRPPPLD